MEHKKCHRRKEVLILSIKYKQTCRKTGLLILLRLINGMIADDDLVFKVEPIINNVEESPLNELFLLIL